jgi:hypothetical protein
MMAMGHIQQTLVARCQFKTIGGVEHGDDRREIIPLDYNPSLKVNHDDNSVC